MKLFLSYFGAPIAAVMFVLLVVAFAGQRPAFATDAGSCYAIGDSDQRAYCLAKAHRDSGRCYSIQNSGLRAQCIAEVRR